MNRAYFDSSITEFVLMPNKSILGALASNHGHALELLQRDAWQSQISHLKEVLPSVGAGHVFIEFSIPRMGKRADVVVLANDRILVLEYKVGARSYEKSAIEQTIDYALDLKNFHEGSHDLDIVPILVATDAPTVPMDLAWSDDRIAHPILANASNLAGLLSQCAGNAFGRIDPDEWQASRYKPTPTIVEAARALYARHRVEEISRSDSGAINLSRTTNRITKLIEHAKSEQSKIICFVTGVPGSGKTLAGLNLATKRMLSAEDEHAVFLSGNGPLVAVLREALARDQVERSTGVGHKVSKRSARQKANTFIQNIHHFRDECLTSDRPPIEKVVVFDEAQRAWNLSKTSSFMKDRKSIPDFSMSESEFLLSAMDRHPDWCVVVCLVGNGQEINTGEAGIGEWFLALTNHYPNWEVYHSPSFAVEPGDKRALESLPEGAVSDPDLHLGVSVRSFRAERLAEFVSAVLLGEQSRAAEISVSLENYPIAITRELSKARTWLMGKARGSERYGLVASSNALRLKPLGLHMKSKIDAPNWFLGDSNDVRSSFALEDAASEFEVQGLELDWVGVCWDANLRNHDGDWTYHRFFGSRWESVNANDRRSFLLNAYRVLLTRARQGMIVVVPEGSDVDATRTRSFYDGTYEFLVGCGLTPLE